MFKKSLLSRPTGLFGYDALKGDYGFKKMADDALLKSQRIVDAVVSADTDQELLHTIKRLDRLSDILCSVIDSAQLIQFVHPHKNIRDDAHDAFKRLSNYLNSLNTCRELYCKLKILLNNPTLAHKLGVQEKIVGDLLLKDFEKSGIDMSAKKKEQYVRYHEKILDLGTRFMDQTAGNQVVVATKELTGLVDVREPWITVDSNSYLAYLILYKCRNSKIRRDIYLAMNSGTAEQIGVLEELLKNRADLANLLMEKSYSHMFLKDKMVKTPGSLSF